MVRIWEKNSAYFFNLEKKKRGKTKRISSLYIEGNLVTDKTRVSPFVSSFYSQLSTSSFKPDFSDRFFERVQAFKPSISDGNLIL